MLVLRSRRIALAKILDYSGANRVLSRIGSWSGLLVLNYHRIGDADHSSFDPGVFTATPEAFESQVRHLARNCDLVGGGDLTNLLARRRGRAVMITFDDGYRDNYDLAFPILRAHRAPATFFLSTGFIDEPQVPWWDEIAWMVYQSTRRELSATRWTPLIRLQDDNRRQVIRLLQDVYLDLPAEQTGELLEMLAEATGVGRCPAAAAKDLWMTWDMTREMSQSGMHFGGHTVSHPCLTKLPPESQGFEVRRCRERIAEELGHAVTVFSFPFGVPGTFSEETDAQLRTHGYDWAFTFFGGFNSWQSVRPYRLARTPVPTNANPALFRALLAAPQVFCRPHRPRLAPAV